MKSPRKFSLATMLIVLTTLTVGFGYVIRHREVGSDQLVALIQQIGGQNHAGDGNTYCITTNYSPTAYLFGNRQVVMPSVHFGVGQIDAAAGRALAKNVAANGKVHKVTFYQTQIADDCPFFVWDSVTHIEFEDTKKIPDSWIEKIAASSSIKRISFSGADTDISFEQLSTLKYLNFMRLSNLGIYGERLEELKTHLDRTSIKISGLWGYRWPYRKDQTLSQHDPEALLIMKEVLDELKSEMQNLERPATNQFNPPATIPEIAELEQLIGQPLPKYLRALLEIHNGQKSLADSVFSFGRLLSTKQMLEEYQLFDRPMIESSYETADWPPSMMTFAKKTWGSLYEWHMNLESGLISLGASRINFGDTGENLPEFIRTLTKNIRNGNYKQDSGGRVLIKRQDRWYPGDDFTTLRR